MYLLLFIFSQYVKELYNSSFHFQVTKPACLSASRVLELNVDIYGLEPFLYAPAAYPVYKSFKFQVSSSKLFFFELFRRFTIHLSINCMNVCVVIFNRVLFLFVLLILSFFGT